MEVKLNDGRQMEITRLVCLNQKGKITVVDVSSATEITKSEEENIKFNTKNKEKDGKLV